MSDDLTPEQTARLQAEVYPLMQAAYRHELNGEMESRFRLQRQALAKTEAIFGPVDDNVATFLTLFAADLYPDGDYEEAEVLCLRALSIYEMLFGSVHLEVTGALFWLGCLYDNWERYEQSLPTYRRSLAIEETLCGVYSSEAAMTCTWLGDAHRDLGQYAQSEVYFQRAILIWQARRAVDGTAQLTLTEERLAGVLFRLKRYGASLTAYQDVLSLNDGKFHFVNSRRRLKTCLAKCAPKDASIAN